MFLTVALMTLVGRRVHRPPARIGRRAAAAACSASTSDERTDTTAISLIGVSKRFGELVAVRELDLDVRRGEFFSIIGPSGCGKTTTLRMIAGFEEPTAGTIEVGGRDVTRVRPYRRSVNTVFQSYALFPHLDVWENVAFGLREARRPRAEIASRVAEAIELVAPRGPRAGPAALSCRAASSSASRWPARSSTAPTCCCSTSRSERSTSSCARSCRPSSRTSTASVGITFCYVTHDQGEAFSMSDRVAVMNAGVLEQVGHARGRLPPPASAFVADFVGASNRLPGAGRAERRRRPLPGRDRRRRRALGARAAEA